MHDEVVCIRLGVHASVGMMTNLYVLEQLLWSDDVPAPWDVVKTNEV
jgi:hypothetical protein